MIEKIGEYGGVIARVDVGPYITPDNWGIGNCLTKGLEGFCDYYLPVNSGGPIKEVAVNIEITGRTRQRRNGDYYVRVKITFVGDGEPDTITHGWVRSVWN